MLGTRFSAFAAYGRRPSGRIYSAFGATVAAALFLGAAGFAAPAALAQETVVIGSGGSGVEINLDVLDSLGRPPGIFGRRPPLYGERNVDVPRLRPPAGMKAPAPVSSRPAPSLGAGSLSASPAIPPGITPLPRPGAMTATPAPARPVQPLQPAQPGTRTAAVPPPAPTAPPAATPPTPQKVSPPVQEPQGTLPAPQTSAPPAPRPAPQPPVTAAPAPQAPAPKTPVPQAEAPEPPRIVANKPAPAPSGGTVTVRFKPGFSELDGPARRALAALAQELVRSNGRVQLKAYAGVNDGTPAEARRLSLSRALAVRSFLIEEGVRATRIDVRALGAPKDGSDPERVEVIRLGG